MSFKFLRSLGNSPKPQRSVFDFSHQNTFTTDAGILTPCLLHEVLPNDEWHINGEMFFRTIPLATPSFAQVDGFIDFFFVPNRILIPDWENFISRGPRGDRDIILPYIDCSHRSTNDAHKKQFADEDNGFLQAAFQSKFGNSEVTYDTANQVPYEVHIDPDTMETMPYPLDEFYKSIFGRGTLFDYLNLNMVISDDTWDSDLEKEKKSNLDYIRVNNDGSLVNGERNFPNTHCYNILPLLAYQRVYYDHYRDINFESPITSYTGIALGETSYASALDPFELDATVLAWLFDHERLQDEKLRETSPLNSSTITNFLNLDSLGTATGNKSIYFGLVRNLIRMRYHNYEKDYFTTCLPWLQRGPEMQLPQPNYVQVPDYIEGSPSAESGPVVFEAGQPQRPTPEHPHGKTPIGYVAGTDTINQGEIKATNLPTIPLLRLVAKIQEFFERNLRGGDDPQKMIRQHFGTAMEDGRYRASQYLGGYKMNLHIGEVLQTSATTENTPSNDLEISPLGNYAGRGVGGRDFSGIHFSSREHGFIIGIASFVPRTMYKDGVHKAWLRGRSWDFAIPEFANLEEQEVQLQELYNNYRSNDLQNYSTFGYIPRYAEYKGCGNETHGWFRDESFASWNIFRNFDIDQQPNLNSVFVKCFPNSLDSIFAVASSRVNEHRLLCNMSFDTSVKRVLPKQVTPFNC